MAVAGAPSEQQVVWQSTVGTCVAGGAALARPRCSNTCAYLSAKQRFKGADRARPRATPSAGITAACVVKKPR